MERLTKVSAVGEHLPRKPLNLIHKSDSSESNLTEILEKLGKYEDAEEQGLFIKIPCHCKDCSHWVDGCAGCTEHVKLCDVGHYMVGENGYCLYAEQKVRNNQ